MNKYELHTSNKGREKITPEDGLILQDDDMIYYRNSDYDFVKSIGIAKGVRVIRNPLAVVNSCYFAHRNVHKIGDWYKLAAQRKLLQAVSKSVGMGLTLGFLEDPEFFPCSPGPFYALSKWDDSDENFMTYRMEDMVAAPNVFLEKAIRFQGGDPGRYRLVIEEKFTFKHMTGREVGEIDSNAHMRSGKHDDWQEHLPVYVQDYVKTFYRDIFEKYYPDILK